MYSDSHQCIFVHQRKAAGTSVKALFADAMPGFNDGILDPQWNSSNERVRDYFKFTVVRNPWDRFISGWRYLKSTRHRSIEDVLNNLPQPRLMNNILLHDSSMRARIAYSRELARRQSDRWFTQINNLLAKTPQKLPHDQGHDFRHITRQQHASVIDSHGKLAVDVVLYVEDLEAGLIKHAQRLGIDPAKLERKNQKRHHDDYRKYFNTHTLDLFNAIFADDIRIWGYDFERGPGVSPNRSPQG